MKELDVPLVFTEADFKTIQLINQYGEIYYYDSPTKPVRIQLAQSASLALGYVIGVKKRFTKDQWMKIWEEWKDWGKEFQKDTSEEE